MTLTEQDKFQILCDVAKQTAKVIIKRNQKYLDGEHISEGSDDTLIVHILPLEKMTEAYWSEAASLLCHEMGHCISMSSNERKAWSYARKWVNKMPYLMPNMFSLTERAVIKEYKVAHRKERELGKVGYDI
jgi:hypothetical protein